MSIFIDSSELYKHNQTGTPASKTEYYAAANTCRGFVSFFDEIFGSLPTLYIIKGGSGTGKSRFMREVAAASEAIGMDVEYYYCSSDPSSLDGIVLRDIKTGIMDGTAPHTRDPKYPGATDTILNFGDFWDSGKLSENSARIHELIDRKNSLWKTAYDYLCAAEQFDRIVRTAAAECILYDKLGQAAARTLKNVKSGDGSSCRTRMTDAICGEKNVYLPTFENSADEKYYIHDDYGCGYLFLRSLLSQAAAKKLSATISRMPLNPEIETGVSLCGGKLAFVLSKEPDDEAGHIINMNRFTDKKKLSEIRPRLRRAVKLRDQTLDEAGSVLRQIRLLHSDLETIYISAMDFDKKERFTRKFIGKLFDK